MGIILNISIVFKLIVIGFIIWGVIIKNIPEEVNEFIQFMEDSPRGIYL